MPDMAMASGRLRAVMLMMVLAIAGCNKQADQACAEWPEWARYADHLISPGGRVIDRASGDARTVSEGQAYALFYALVANDRQRFATILAWTENNLAGGDLTARLPAWLWGEDKTGNWGVIDSNSASDADVWLAYTLLEAGRLWSEPRYTALSALLQQRILKEETESLPGLGLTLLPAPQGFRVSATQWKLNPSYVPLQVMQGMAQADAAWAGLLGSSQRLITESSIQGFVPDWVIYDAQSGFVNAPAIKGNGYDSVRVYLWAGMLHPQQPGRKDLLEALAGMSDWLQAHGVPPASIPPIKAADDNSSGPSGFSAALLPFLSAVNEPGLLQQQENRLQARPIPADAYYQQSLALFGQGWLSGRYRFDAQGRLVPAWKSSCPE